MGKYTKYPNQIDGEAELPLSTDLVTPVQAEVVNRLRDAILAIEAELGTLPSSTFGSVKARFDAMQNSLNSALASIAAIEDELGTNPSGAFDTVAARLASITTDVNQLLIDMAFLNATADVVTHIISGSEDTNSSTFTAKGAGLLNPTSLGHPAVSFTLEVLLQTTDAAFDGYFELFNITEGVSVDHAEIRTIATVPTFFSITITVGGSDLPASQNNVLEGRIRLTTGAAADDRVVCKYAAIRSKLS